MKRKFLSALFVLFLTCCLVACNGLFGTAGDCAVEFSSETRVVISVQTDGGSVLSCMEKLGEELVYETSDGMVTSINGKANAADFSACWMLYTSDIEQANASWGTVEYDGKTLGSAMLGAELLEVKAGEIYLWEYVSF